MRNEVASQNFPFILNESESRTNTISNELRLEELGEQIIMRAILDKQDDDGDSFLHRELRTDNDFSCIVNFLRAGGDIHIRNHNGRSALHEAAKFSPLGVRAIELLLAFGAHVNSTDDEGSSILHDALKSTWIKLEVVECLLDAKANPNLRDVRNIPPLGYVENSSLSDSHKLRVEKLFIQYSVIKMFEDFNFDDDSDDNLDPEGILCLHFCKNKEKRNQYANMRDSCIREVLKMEKEKISGDVTFFKVIYKYCYGDKMKLNKSSVEKATFKLDQKEYPHYEEIVRRAVKYGYKK